MIKRFPCCRGKFESGFETWPREHFDSRYFRKRCKSSIGFQGLIFGLKRTLACVSRLRLLVLQWNWMLRCIVEVVGTRLPRKGPGQEVQPGRIPRMFRMTPVDLDSTDPHLKGSSSMETIDICHYCRINSPNSTRTTKRRTLRCRVSPRSPPYWQHSTAKSGGSHQWHLRLSLR